MAGFNYGDRVSCPLRWYTDEQFAFPHYVVARQMLDENGAIRVALPDEEPMQYIVRRLEVLVNPQTAVVNGQLVEAETLLSLEPGGLLAHFVEPYVPPEE